MKKRTWFLLIALGLYGSLIWDTLSFRERLAMPDGEGVGLYLFFGLVELKDKIPYQAAPGYLYALYAALFAGGIAMILLTRYCIRAAQGLRR